MTNKQLSKFRQKPKSKIGWVVLGLGLPLILIGPILGIFASAIRPLIDKSFGVQVGALAGLLMIIILLVDLIACLILGLFALKKGERSWAVWVGFIPAALAALFLLFMLVGELFLPH